MNRAEFMSRLRELLSDITESEREEALNYYEDYFDDAGVENEASVIASLGSPEKVATTIKYGLNEENKESAEYSESGYSDYTYERNEVAQRTPQKRDLRGGLLIVVIILAIFALPILGPLGVALLSVLFSIIVVALVLLFTVAIAGVAIGISGVALVVAGFIALFSSALTGALLLGVGLVLIGIGVLVTILGIWILTKVVPPLFRGFINLCRKPFEKKKMG